MTSEQLYSRLVDFAKRNQQLLKSITFSAYNRDYISQLSRSSGSVGANYIEAIEGISKKDFIHRLKMCRKETRESIHWLTLIQSSDIKNVSLQRKINELIPEAQELVKIFTASILTAEKNQKINK